MSRSQIEAAVERNSPFTIRMADGEECQVPHRDHIAVSPKAAIVVVFDDAGHDYVLPLLTMTGLVTSPNPRTRRPEVPDDA